MANLDSLASLGITTSESFVQKLKGAADPIPVERSRSSISKIDLALLAWTQSQQTSSSDHLAIPRLHAVLLGWTLDTLSSAAKASAKAATIPSSSPLAQPSYYSLLSTLLNDSKVATSQTAISSISPRTNSQSLLLVVSSLLRLEPLQRQQCLPLAAKPVAQLVTPYLASLATSSNLRQQLDELVRAFCLAASHLQGEDVALARALNRLLQLVAKAWVEGGQEHPQLAAKSSQAFLETTLTPWAEALQHLQRSSDPKTWVCGKAFSSLRKTLVGLGEEALFSAASLKTILFPFPHTTPSKGLVQQLQAGEASSSLFPILPDIVLAAISQLRRHSNELSIAARSQKKKGPASSAEQQNNEGDDSLDVKVNLPAALLETFIFPALRSLSDAPGPAGSTIQAAESRTKVLAILVQADYQSRIASQPAWESAMSELATAILSECQSSEEAAVMKASITNFRHLWQLSQDAVRNQLPDLLGRLTAWRLVDSTETTNEDVRGLCTNGDVRAETQDFVDDLLETFSRSQELPYFLGLLSQHFGSSSVDQWEKQSVFDVIAFSSSLSKAIRAYVAPTQAAEVLTQLVDRVESVRSESNGQPASSSKKRAHSTSSIDRTGLCNLLRLNHIVLASLSTPLAISDAVNPCLDRLLAQLKSTLHEAVSKDNQPAAPSKPKKARKSESNPPPPLPRSPANAQVAAATLWCWYGLCVGRLIVDRESGNEALEESGKVTAGLNDCWETLLPILSQDSNDSDIGRLRLEAVRLLLFKRERSLQPEVVDSTPSAELEAPFWTTTAEVLDNYQDQQTRRALWEMLATRWLNVLERCPPPGFLLSAAQRLLLTLCQDEDRAVRHISRAIASDASFQELPKWRSQVVELIMGDSEPRRGETQVVKILSTLAAFPVQYIPAENRETLTERALESISTSPITLSIRHHTGVGQWLVKVFQTPGRLTDSLAKQASEALTRMMPLLTYREEDSGQGKDLLRQVDIELMLVLTKKLVQHQQIDDSSLEEVCTAMSESDETRSILAEILANAPSSTVPANSLPTYTLEVLEDRLFGNIGSLVAAADQLKETAVTLRLNLRPEPSKTLAAAENVAAKVFASPYVSSSGRLIAVEPSQSARNGFLVEFLALASSCAEAKAARLGSRVCLSFAGLFAITSDQDMTASSESVEQAYGRFLTLLTPEEYNVTLSALFQAFDMTPAEASKDITALLSTIGLSLRHGPEGTTFTAQRHFTRLLTKIKGADDHGMSLLNSLYAIEPVCNGRMKVLRPIDAGILISILSDLLAPCKGQVRQVRGPPGSRIFSGIVNILASMIRLRRELLVPILPQLGTLISRLPALFRESLPNASSSQRARFADSMPIWLAKGTASANRDDDEDDEASANYFNRDSHQMRSVISLGEVEAREFSRLLDTITSKTTTLSRKDNALMGSSRQQTTDSLAHPFSKHAIYVILSYIHALFSPQDQHATIPSKVRRELNKGVVGLCGIIGESERDWILVSELLDEGGKMVFKEIWTIWEKSRYRGA